MAQKAPLGTESLMHRLSLRETRGSLQPHCHARQKKLFTKIPGRLGFCLKSLVPQFILEEGHVFLGFTKNGQFVISYSLHVEADEHTAYPVYIYRLQWWLFVPHRPLKQISEVRLFGEEQIERDLYLAVCEWPRDNKKVLIYGQSVPVCGEENYQCYITVTAFPPLVPCKECATTENVVATETGVPAWCLNHAVTVHTKYDLAPPYPSFSPHVNMKLDGVMILNTGHSIITLDISCGEKQDEDWSDYTNCSTPLGEPEPESPLGMVTIETDLESEENVSSSATPPGSGKLHKDAILSISQEYLNSDRETFENSSVCDSSPPAHCYHGYCPPPAESGDRPESQTTTTSDSQKSRLTLYDFAGSDDGSVVDEDSRSGFAHPRFLPNLTGSRFNDDATDAKCHCGDSRLQSKYLRQQLQQSMHFSHGLRTVPSQALSPGRGQSLRKCYSQENMPPSQYDSTGQGHSSQGDGNTMYEVCCTSPSQEKVYTYLGKTDHVLHEPRTCVGPCDKENVCIPPASPNHRDLNVVEPKNTPHLCGCTLKTPDPLTAKPVGNVELLHEVRTSSQRSFFSPSISGSTGSCASKASTSPIIYLDSSQSVTMNIRKFTYPAPVEVNPEVAEQEDDLELAYHSLLPLTVSGTGNKPMTVVNNSCTTTLKHEVTMKQLTFDVEHYLGETIRHHAEWGNRYIDVADYDIQVLDVCPSKYCLIAKVMLWVHAKQESRHTLDVKRRKALGLYQTSFTFEWQQDSGMYNTLDIEDLQEIEEKNLRKQTRGQQRKDLLSLRKQAYVPQSYSTSVHVLTNEAVLKGKSLPMLLDPHHYVAILL